MKSSILWFANIFSIEDLIRWPTLSPEKSEIYREIDAQQKFTFSRKGDTFEIMKKSMKIKFHLNYRIRLT